MDKHSWNRQCLRHDYYAISNEIIWKVVCDDLPPLKAAVEHILARLVE